MARGPAIRSLFRRKSFLALNLGVLLLIAWGFTGEYMRNKDLVNEVDTLEQRSQELTAHNLKLAELADRLSDPEMVEREARLKLNLQKPGEEVVVVRDVTPAAMAHAADAPEGGGDPVEGPRESNPRKWLRHFFNRQK